MRLGEWDVKCADSHNWTVTHKKGEPQYYYPDLKSAATGVANVLTTTADRRTAHAVVAAVNALTSKIELLLSDHPRPDGSEMDDVSFCVTPDEMDDPCSTSPQEIESIDDPLDGLPAF